jgi:1,4-alpha-glucan branching enzyme
LLAAGLVGIGVIAGAYTHNRDVQPGGEPTVPVASQLPVSDTVVKLYFVAPGAAKVSLVGDFNGWDDTKTPMARTPKDGLWAVTLPLTAGRHQYAFVVNGKTWRPDPDAPVAPDDGYGHASSVMIVHRGSAL